MIGPRLDSGMKISGPKKPAANTMTPTYRSKMSSFLLPSSVESTVLVVIDVGAELAGTEGGVTVHLVDAKIDNGPILVQKRYRIHQHDTLEQIMARSKILAAEAIIESVRLVEGGRYTLLPNDESEATHFSMPTRQDTLRFRAAGRRFH